MTDLPWWAPHIEYLAERIGRGKTPSNITDQMIEWTKEAWRREDLRDSAMVIIRAFPRDFPLMAEKAAE